MRTQPFNDAVVDGEPDDLSWRDLAACTEFDPLLFFPAGDTGAAAHTIVDAKRICDSCIVKADCLVYAVETNQVNGIWGGTTEQERRLIRRRWMAARRRNDASALEHVLDAV